MPDGFSILVSGDNEIIAKFKTFGNINVLNEALINCSHIVLRRAQENLNEMIYSQPETKEQKALYPRTHFLFDKTLASGEVKRENSSTIVTTVKSETYYAKIVHFGTGRGRNSIPRPYLTKALHESKQDIQEEMSKDALNN